MTTLTHTYSGLNTAPSRLQDILTRLRVRAAGAKSYDKTMRELTAMSARDLADIGISAGMIEDVARQGADLAMAKAAREL